MNNFDFKKYFLFNKYKMPQHIRTMTSQHIRNNKNVVKEKIMSYMPQSIRSYIMKQEINVLTLIMIILFIIGLVFAGLIYFGAIEVPFKNLYGNSTAPKQNLQYFFF